MYTPPGTPRSRSFTRFTMRVGLEHFGQSVLLVVSITFLRSAVLAIFAMALLLILVSAPGRSRQAARRHPSAFAVIHLVCAGRTRLAVERFSNFTRPEVPGLDPVGVIKVTEPCTQSRYVQGRVGSRRP